MIQNPCYISVTQRYIEKRKKGYLLMKIALVLLSGAFTLYLAQQMAQKCLSWAALPVSASGIIKFDSDLILSKAMQNIGTEPSNPVYW